MRSRHYKAVKKDIACVLTIGVCRVSPSIFRTELHMLLFNQMIHETLQRRDNDSLE